MNLYYMEDDDYELVKSLLLKNSRPDHHPCTTLQVVLIYDTNVVCSVLIAVTGLYARLMRLVDLNNTQQLDDPAVFDRALTVIEDEDTRWVPRHFTHTLITPDRHKVNESQLEKIERLYGPVNTPLELAHSEVDELSDTDSPEYNSAQAWERALRNPRGDLVETYRRLGGDIKQLPARMALHRLLVQGNNPFTIAWRYMLKKACMDKEVYIRLSVFLGASELGAAKSFDERIDLAQKGGYAISCKELAGIDALNRQHDKNGAGLSEKEWTPSELEESGDDCIAYNMALAWRDTITEGEPTYAKYAELFNSNNHKLFDEHLVIPEAELKATFTGYMNRYATPGMSKCDPFARLWFEETRRKRVRISGSTCNSSFKRYYKRTPRTAILFTTLRHVPSSGSINRRSLRKRKHGYTRNYY